MPINSDADVTTIIKGLALCCQHKKRERWDVIFPLVGEHNLQVNIFRESKLSNHKELLHTIPSSDLKAGRLHLETDYAVWDNKFYFTGRDGFSWSQTENNDENDFNFFIDLDDDQLTHSEMKMISVKVPVIFLSLQQTMFYADTLTEEPYGFFDMNNPHDIPKYLYNLGKTIGGYLKINDDLSAAVNFKFDENPTHNQTLDNFSQYKYIIEFDNDCEGKRMAEKDRSIMSPASDFPEYYNLVNPINSNDTRRYTLVRLSQIEGRTDCDGVWLSKMDGLFDY